MDIPSSPIIAELVKRLQTTYGLQTFVETGTYLGATARWASSYFERVVSIELSEMYWRQSRRGHADRKNIKFVLGDSRQKLAQVIGQLQGPALFWLDAHWSGGSTSGQDDECPVLDELRIIMTGQFDAFIFIDDARLFLAPPPLPHDPTYWPDIATVISVLQESGKAPHIFVFEDVIIVFPTYTIPLITAYCQEIATKSQLQEIPVRAPTRPILPENENALHFLQRSRLVKAHQPFRLHLGCGEMHRKGYVNIDFVPEEFAVQQKPAADVYGDIRLLDFPENSVDEVRLHHVFEHFDRPTALGLLIHWQRWLRPGGILVIETPDLEACARQAISDPDLQNRNAAIRHLFGSHEAQWAVHWDGWYQARFEITLDKLGFYNLKFQRGRWKALDNLVVTATKAPGFNIHSLRVNALRLLRTSLVDRSVQEERLWQIWQQRLDRVIAFDAISLPAPLLSIFIPVYNRQQYLGATLDSLLDQSFSDFEIVIADDGSEDGSLDLAFEYAFSDPRVKVLPLTHAGEIVARNAAIQFCHPGSKYLLNHDSDDISLPDKLRSIIRHLEDHPEVAILGCQAEYFDDEGRCLGNPPVANTPEEIRKSFGRANFMTNSATVIRRSVFDKIGLYRTKYPAADDYDFFARALLAGYNLSNLPEMLHRIRIHPTSISSTRAYLVAFQAERIKLNYILSLAQDQTIWNRILFRIKGWAKICLAFLRLQIARLYAR